MISRRKFLQATGLGFSALAVPMERLRGQARSGLSLGEWFAANQTRLYAVREFIRKEMQRIIDRKYQTPRLKGPALPYPYIPVSEAPGFCYLVYWDNYFTTRLLLRDGHLEVAKNQVRNLISLMAKYGYVPNGNNYLWADSSQPPLLSRMVMLIHNFQDDPGFLRECYPDLKQEHEFWQGPLHLVKEYGLNRYQDTFSGWAKILGYPENFLSNSEAEVEAGWDYTVRFESRCLEFLPVDLNAFLYQYERDLEFISERLSLGTAEINLWSERADSRREKFNRIFWDSRREFYFDYDFKHQQPGRVWSLAGYLPIWAGLADQGRIEKAIKALARFEQAYGLSVTDQDYGKTSKQWDYPNAWPPLTWWVEEVLQQNGFVEQARRAIRQYLEATTSLYEDTGSLWEKYNAVTGGLDTVGGPGYKPVPMLGWSASVFMDFYDLAAKAAKSVETRP